MGRVFQRQICIFELITNIHLHPDIGQTQSISMELVVVVVGRISLLKYAMFLDVAFLLLGLAFIFTRDNENNTIVPPNAT